MNPGYQGSETSGGDLYIYPQSGDPVVVRSKTKLDYDGRKDSSEVGMLLSLQTQKQMGAASGSWSAQIKPYPGNESLFNHLVDDDWVDIVWRRHGKPWHTMRGLIDDVRRVRSVSSSGATVTVYQITGRDFGKILETIQIWFSAYTDTVVLGAAAYKTIDQAKNTLGPPNEAVEVFIRDMIRELRSMDTGRATWLLPDSMPDGGNFFNDVMVYDDTGYQAYPERIAVNVSWMNIQGVVWSLASEYSDPVFNELFCDTRLHRWDPSTQEAKVEDTFMHVYLRTRPFPLASPEILGALKGGDSPYFDLPLHTIPVQHLGATDVGRSGYERFNAFFHAPQMTQDAMKAGIDWLGPLWSPDDIYRHGLRRFDVQSRYARDPNKLDDKTYMEQQRLRVRDWHCLNPYYLSGTLNTIRGYPQIHIGDRIRVPGNTPAQDETFYVESAGHAWQFGTSIKSSFGVTHGWIGSDYSQLKAILDMSDMYDVALLAGTS